MGAAAAGFVGKGPFLGAAALTAAGFEATCGHNVVDEHHHPHEPTQPNHLDHPAISP